MSRNNPKIILVPDSFKGTMSALEVCAVMEQAALALFPQAQVVSLPVADGGEGSVECLVKAAGGRCVPAQVQGPYGQPMEAFYGLLPDGTAVVETASCAGLPLVEGDARPDQTTTFGVGQLLLQAAEAGARRILLGLGGSCTNDGGCGAAAACGVRFFRADGEAFVPVGGTLKDIASLSADHLDPRLQGVEIACMCDIDNPFYGEEGAAFVFASQKGAGPDAVRLLDQGLRHLAAEIQRCLGRDISALPGAGAAGGLGGGMAAFLGARLLPGIDAVLDAVRFEEALQGADLILTGEGRVDGQTLRGKAVLGVARRARGSGVPVVAVTGDAAQAGEGLYQQGVAALFSINRSPMAFAQARHHSKENLYQTTENILRLAKQLWK